MLAHNPPASPAESLKRRLEFQEIASFMSLGRDSYLFFSAYFRNRSPCFYETKSLLFNFMPQTIYCSIIPGRSISRYNLLSSVCSRPGVNGLAALDAFCLFSRSLISELVSFTSPSILSRSFLSFVFSILVLPPCLFLLLLSTRYRNSVYSILSP